MHRLRSLGRRTSPWYRREEGLTVVEWVGMVAVMAALLMTMMVFFSQRGNIVATATLDAMRCHIQMVGGCGEPGDSTAAGAEGSGTTTAGNTSGGVTAAEPPQWSDPADADASTAPDAAAPPSNNPFANFTIMDWVQLILDVVGFIPIAGEVADFINAIISLVRGDLVGAGLSVAAMWPAGGQGVTIAKISVKYGDEVAAVIKNLDEAVAGVRKGGDEVADGVNTAKRIPCVTGAVPVGRVPGLAAPHDPCAVIAARLDVDLAKLEIVPGSISGRVFRTPDGHGTLDEVLFADEIASREGRDLVLSKIKNQEAVDGFYRDTGQPIQIKELSTSNPDVFVKRINKAYDSAKRHSWDDVEVQVKAENLTVAQIEERWLRSPRQPSPQHVDSSDNTIQRIFVKAKDGTTILHLPN